LPWLTWTQSFYLFPHVAGMTDMRHHALLFCWDRVSLTFCPGWPWSKILPISISPGTGMTGVCYHTWLRGGIFEDQVKCLMFEW
jgi:hypothetical protein